VGGGEGGRGCARACWLVADQTPQPACQNPSQPECQQSRHPTPPHPTPPALTLTPPHLSSARRMNAASFSTSRMNIASLVISVTCGGGDARAWSVLAQPTAAGAALQPPPLQPPPPLLDDRAAASQCPRLPPPPLITRAPCQCWGGWPSPPRPCACSLCGRRPP